jgi:hypothetical protein
MTEVPTWHIAGDWFDNCSCAVRAPAPLPRRPITASASRSYSGTSSAARGILVRADIAALFGNSVGDRGRHRGSGDHGGGSNRSLSRSGDCHRDWHCSGTCVGHQDCRRRCKGGLDEVRDDQDRQSGRLASSASGARMIRQPAYRHGQPDPDLPAGMWRRRAARAALLARRVATLLDTMPPDVLSPRMVRIISSSSGQPTERTSRSRQALERRPRPTTAGMRPSSAWPTRFPAGSFPLSLLLP